MTEHRVRRTPARLADGLGYLVGRLVVAVTTRPFGIRDRRARPVDAPRADVLFPRGTDCLVRIEAPD